MAVTIYPCAIDATWSELSLAALVQASISITNVMPKNDEYAIEIARLRQTAAESRLRAVESQLALALTLCAMAETEILYRRPDEASKVIQKVRHHTEVIRFHLDEPNHLPKNGIPGLRKPLALLKKRIEEIESRLRQM